MARDASDGFLLPPRNGLSDEHGPVEIGELERRLGSVISELFDGRRLPGASHSRGAQYFALGVNAAVRALSSFDAGVRDFQCPTLQNSVSESNRTLDPTSVEGSLLEKEGRLIPFATRTEIRIF